MMAQRPGFLRIHWIILGLAIASCAMEEEAEVKKALEARRLGLEKKDIQLYMSSISMRYRGRTGDASQVQGQAMAMMNSFDSIEMRIESRKIEMYPERAEALQRFKIRVHKGDQIKDLEGQEKIFLEKEREEWKIVSGL